jgi:prolyl-tRNA editing enzyme YbaK/EbsC (Cys-tRNA(Pro) deacylase)
MTEIVSSPVTALLQNSNVAFEQIEIPLSPDKKPIRALEEILGEHGFLPGSVVRSILFRTDAGKYVLLAMAGSGKADWGVLRKHLNERRLTLADPAEVVAQTGYVVGAVPPLALPETIQVLADESLRDYERLLIGSGVLGYAFGLQGADLCGLMDAAEFGQFGKMAE